MARNEARRIGGEDGNGNEFGPWFAGEIGKTVFIQSDDFTHDVRLVVTGDFRNKAELIVYSEKLAAILTKATAQGFPP